MAVTKIHPIKSTLKKALDYIENPDKTDEKLFVSSYGCSYETADIEFQMLLDQAYQKGNNLAHHLIQAFEPGETTAEQAHDCLLYTSPSPRDVEESRMPSSA